VFAQEVQPIKGRRHSVAKDPICGMYVDEKTGTITRTIHGTKWYFCSETCAQSFEKPEVEFNRLKALLVASLVLTIPTALLTYLTMFTTMRVIPENLTNYILFLLETPVQFWVGWRFYRGAYDAIRNRMGNMDLLIALGTSAAWIYSTIVTFLPWVFPASGAYFDAAAIIITLILAGNLLEHKQKRKASESVRKLLDLQPRMAHLVRDDVETDVPVESVSTGDLLLVRPGERVPVDGLVIEGNSAVDQSAITGESIPTEKRVNDEVIGGTINTSGLLRIRASKVGADTVLSSIARLVEEAQMARAPIQRLADRVAEYFVPAVVLIATAAALGWLLFGGLTVNFALLVFVSVIVIACPCALGLATPAAIMVGTAKGAQNGILIKGGEYLETAHKVQTVVFDKTGTLTMGKPSVTDVIGLRGQAADDVLRLAAVVEKGSEHPLGRAVLQAAMMKGLNVPDASSFKAVPGEGVVVEYNSQTLLLGNRKLMAEYKVDLREIEAQLGILESNGKTVMILSNEKEPLGLIGLADTLKDESGQAVQELQRLKIEVILVTGDNQRTGHAIAAKLGINRVIADVLPQQKATVVKELQKEGRIVAMVGDGVNDAPALAAADIGIAIGSGTDVAVETAGIVLIRNDLRDVVTAIKLSKATVRKIKQNLFWAFCYNVALIPLAAGALVPFFGPGVYNVLPGLAALAMGTSSATVVTNSILLNRFKP
jgi:Cu+-exporting ATPase